MINVASKVDLERWNLLEVLQRHAGRLRVDQGTNGLVLVGDFEFHAVSEGVEVSDEYSVRISIPDTFPKETPRVWETAGRIPRTYHTNPDNSLCLGSRFRLRDILLRNPTLPDFFDKCLMPYLYGFSRHETGNSDPPFGELEHGGVGLLDDYATIFGVSNREAARGMVRLLAMKKRLANKRPCPCGSGLRLGKCHNRLLNKLRSLHGRQWFQQELQGLER